MRKSLALALSFAAGLAAGLAAGGGGRPLPGGVPSEVRIYRPGEPAVLLDVVRFCPAGGDPTDVRPSRSPTLWRVVLVGAGVTLYAEPVTR